MDVIERGFSFITQDKLKEYCKKNHINFELWNYDPELQVHHTRLLEIINYCAMGEFEDWRWKRTHLTQHSGFLSLILPNAKRSK